MFQRKQKPAGDEAPGIPGWIVTFSDCMTLLLCFFVMLVSFSSFDEGSLQQISGAFENRSSRWIFPMMSGVKDSSFEPLDSVVDETAEGSETPTDAPAESIQFPKPPLVILDTDAYRDKKVFHVLSKRLFYGKGAALTAEARRFLRMIASFMRLVPCRVIICETGRTPPPATEADANMPLERAWTIMKYFVDTQGLPAVRFNISASRSAPQGRFRDKQVVQITLLARSIYE